ncbi:MAG: extracellular solute-binding protein [Candidatus Liptonbacteria bacterium]|nr:extracellular solute-binding protein [Candidatus Liptonbacteria bacterium]
MALPKIQPKQIAILLVVLVVLVGIFFLVRSGRRPTPPPIVALSIWGTEPKPAFDKLLESYGQVRPNVQVAYREIDARDYERAVLDALAAGQGPDLVMVPNTSLPRVRNRLQPLDPLQNASLNLLQFRSAFPDVVESDLVLDQKIYALPLYLDTLALFYNRDLFNQAGIVNPPATWDDFLALVPSLRKLEGADRVVQAAAALGGSERSVADAPDILQLLMLQNGTAMINRDRTQAIFATPQAGGESPGLAALNFYLQFSQPAAPSYTWTETQGYSLDKFATGEVAMLIDYRSRLRSVRAKNQFLAVNAAPVPQVAGSDRAVNLARYSALAVTKQSKTSGWAWDFAIYATTNRDAARQFSLAAGYPPALRSLIADALNQPEFVVFAKQALTAQTWYQADDSRARSALNGAIAGVLSGQSTIERALKIAQDQVTETMH